MAIFEPSMLYKQVINFYTHCVIYDKPIKGQLKILKMHLSIDQIIVSILKSNPDGDPLGAGFINSNYGQHTVKILKHLHKLFGQELIKVLNELKSCQKSFGEFTWYCYTLFNIEPFISKLLVMAMNDMGSRKISLEVYDQILKYIYDINPEVIYSHKLLIFDEQYTQVLLKYVDLDKLLHIYITVTDYMYDVDLRILKKYFYRLPYETVATICYECGLDLDGNSCSWYNNNNSGSLYTKYSSMHQERQRKLDLLTKWLRIKLACRRIYYFIQRHIMTKPDAIRRAAEHSYNLSYKN